MPIWPCGLVTGCKSWCARDKSPLSEKCLFKHCKSCTMCLGEDASCPVVNKIPHATLWIVAQCWLPLLLMFSTRYFSSRYNQRVYFKLVELDSGYCACDATIKITKIIWFMLASKVMTRGRCSILLPDLYVSVIPFIHHNNPMYFVVCKFWCAADNSPLSAKCLFTDCKACTECVGENTSASVRNWCTPR